MNKRTNLKLPEIRNGLLILKGTGYFNVVEEYKVENMVKKYWFK